MNIIEIELLTGNVEATLHFYSNLLGLRTIYADAKKISFQAGASTLTFIKAENIKPFYHFAFNIPCNQIEDALHWTSLFTDLIPAPETGFITNFKDWNAKAIYFYDNNGNILECIARFDLFNFSDKPFSAASLLSISEIGIVTESPLELSESLIREHQLIYFKKGPKREDFVAMGDDNGLIVISNPDRNWYPTETHAEKFPVRIRLMNHLKATEITF